ncbi:MAG: hypothetical protein U5L11_09270 [Arhodomonas sp.]|nr:hypothetical protein [Arhodomonas sp.]
MQRRPDLRAALLRVESADAEVAAAIADRYRASTCRRRSPPLPHPRVVRSQGLLRQLAASLACPCSVAGRWRTRWSEAGLPGRWRSMRCADGDGRLARGGAGAGGGACRPAAAGAPTPAATPGGGRTAAVAWPCINGAADYLEVLEALSTLQNVERRALEARWELPLDRVALIRALAGGAFGETGKEDNGH